MFKRSWTMESVSFCLQWKQCRVADLQSVKEMVCAEVGSCGNASSTMQSEGCPDKSVICVSWAASGVCENSPVYMVWKNTSQVSTGRAVIFVYCRSYNIPIRQILTMQFHLLGHWHWHLVVYTDLINMGWSEVITIMFREFGSTSCFSLWHLGGYILTSLQSGML